MGRCQLTVTATIEATILYTLKNGIKLPVGRNQWMSMPERKYVEEEERISHGFVRSRDALTNSAAEAESLAGRVRLTLGGGEIVGLETLFSSIL